MDGTAKRKQVVDDVFSATGAKMAPDDPLVTAALYFSHEMQTAATKVADELQLAADELRQASQLALTNHGAVVADRTKLMKDIEVHVAKCVKAVTKGQSSFHDLQYIPTWYAVVAAFVGAVVLAAAWKLGVLNGSELAEDAAIGRAFKRAVPMMDPKVKAEMVRQFSKK